MLLFANFENAATCENAWLAWGDIQEVPYFIGFLAAFLK
jgi:hypothetical protein